MMTPLDPFVSGVGRIVEYLGRFFNVGSLKEHVVELEGGCSLQIPAGLPYGRRLLNGNYEPEVTELIRATLRSGMGVVDAGANVGYYTLIASRLIGELGSVYAFEPDSVAYRYLEGNVSRNQLTNVLAVRCAVADQSGVLPFTSPILDRGALASTSSRTLPTQIVEVTRLDDFFANRAWPRVDVVKLDVEGAEWAALVGMTELSARNPGLKLIMEFNSATMQVAGKTPADIRDALIKLGFRQGQFLQNQLTVSLAQPLPRTDLVCDVLVTK